MKIINILLVVWLLLLSGSQWYLNKAQEEYSSFQMLIINDNFKNQLMYDNKMFSLYAVEKTGKINNDDKLVVYSPIYINNESLEPLTNAQRKYILEQKEKDEKASI